MSASPVLLVILKLGSDKGFSQQEVHDRIRHEGVAHIPFQFRASPGGCASSSQAI
jgi:hypothetical protein